jgi:histidyl-tRNA synthetase
LNSGNPFEKIQNENAEKTISNFKFLISDFAEKGLRYDLTVPFARYVVMHQNEITFPFKRFQVQPVWRADRPQKGRYREFVQCDADVIGSDSLLNEVELVQIIQSVFSKLNIGVEIKLNNRKILSGIAEIIGEADKIIDITVAIDKLDKIGIEKVNEELITKGVSESAIEKIQPLFSFKGSTEEKISFLKNFLSNSEVGKKGIEEVEYIFNFFSELRTPNSKLELDITLARGLNYYTGAIFEVKVNDNRSTFTSSVLGGGRYDDLTGIFGLPNVSGVGISFGVDRIYDVMEEMKLFDTLNLQNEGTQILFVNFGKEEEQFCLKLLRQVRSAGINAELYPDAAKMKKQMSYADAKKIPFVVLVGTEEMKSGLLTLKNMQSGEQEKITFDELLKKIK